jgi:hypothetical protein
MNEINLALTDISKTLANIVVGPPATSLPAVRALYQVSLAKQMVAGDITYRQFQLRIADWDKKNLTKYEYE